MSAPKPSSQFVESAGLRIHVLSFGDQDASGAGILLLPGITSPAAVWDFVAQPLAVWRAVHVLDLRGRGRSERAPTGAYTLGDYARDAASVIAALNLVRPAIIGHSLGARVAAELSLTDGVDLGGVVLIDPPLSGPGRAPYPFALDFYLNGIRAARAGDVSDRVRRDHPNWADGQVRARARWLGTCDEEAVAETRRNFHREDFVARWRHLIGPVLISGADSPVVPAPAVDELLRLNPSARSIVVPGAGHMIPWDAPDGFRSSLSEALNLLPDHEVTFHA